MGGGIKQPARFVLAVNFDEQSAKFRQQADTHGLIVDIGARAAIGAECPAKKEGAFGLDLAFSQQRQCGVAGGNIEFGGDLRAFGPGAHQTGLPAITEREAQRVQQDGLACAGFTGQYA